MLLWADNFRAFGISGSANLMRQGLYAEMARDLALDPAGSGDPCISVPSGTFSNWRKVLPGSFATVGFGFRLYLPTLPGGDFAHTFRAVDVSNNTLAYMAYRSNGNICILNSSGSVVAETTGPVLVAQSWQHIEVKLLFAGAASTAEVRVDGIPVLTTPSFINIGSTACAQISSGQNSGGIPGSYYLKDLIIWNNVGSRNNDFFGTVIVQSMPVATDIALGDWTLTGGATGHAILAAVPPNDANFLSAAIPPVNPCSFTLTDLPTNVSSVRGLITIVRGKKIDGGDGNVQVSLLSSGDAANGADRPFTPSFTYWYDVEETDPHTSNAWTPASANAADIKMNRTV